MNVVDLPSEQLDALLAQANAALNSGESQEASDIAQDVLARAREHGSTIFEARALAFLGHRDRVLSRWRQACEASQRAAWLFRVAGDEAGEAYAQATLAHVASSLGRNEDAVEAGLMAVQLSARAPGGDHRPFAHNNLGVAYLWSCRFEEAAAEFEAATRLAVQHPASLAPMHPLINLACAESLRLVTERHYTGTRPGADAFCAMVGQAREAAAAERAGSPRIGVGMHATLNALLALYTALAKCWSDDPGGAELALAEAASGVGRYRTTTWLHAMEQWARAELAWTRQDLPRAQAAIEEAARIASEVEHEPLASASQLILSQLHEVQGRPDQALAVLRALRRREARIRAESLESRKRAVAWRLEARDAARHVERLETSSRQLQRISVEDPLTGIVNRRGLEHDLGRMLEASRATGGPVAIAVVDVDRFKQVNDTFSHRVGDAVLRAIARILGAHVRGHDVVARIGGDEFVVAFPETTEAVAAQVCERVRAAVLGFDWPSIATGLAVSVSAGVGQSIDGDNIEALLHRADLSMYARKQASRAPTR
jgi:diguanylate cyclase (GGDEF)-like protein